MASVAGEDKSASEAAGVTSPSPADPRVAAGDVENPASVESVVRRWRREDLLERAALVLRALGCLFSALAFILMATNSHGDWREFDKYEEYRYVVAISILALLYAMVQVLRHVLRLAGRADALSRRAAAIVDFAGDQIVAYLLISALSAAIPMTNRMREGADNIFTDTTSASLSMAFFAFAALALSAMISGFKLSTQTYI